jgi:hypothetical protein
MSRLPLIVLVVLAGLFAGASIEARQTTPPPKPVAGTPVPTPQPAPATPAMPASSQTTPPPAAPRSRIDGEAMPTQNVRVEVTITDTFGAAPVRKTVSMLMADTRGGRVRSSLNVVVPKGDGTTTYSPIVINVDATPEVRADGRVFLHLTVQYTPDSPYLNSGSSQSKPADINESFTVVLPDGKATTLSQSADPQSDRKVTLEVTATVVK